MSGRRGFLSAMQRIAREGRECSGKPKPLGNGNCGKKLDSRGNMIVSRFDCKRNSMCVISQTGRAERMTQTVSCESKSSPWGTFLNPRWESTARFLSHHWSDPKIFRSLTSCRTDWSGFATQNAKTISSLYSQWACSKSCSRYELELQQAEASFKQGHDEYLASEAKRVDDLRKLPENHNLKNGRL